MNPRFSWTLKQPCGIVTLSLLFRGGHMENALFKQQVTEMTFSRHYIAIFVLSSP